MICGRTEGKADTAPAVLTKNTMFKILYEQRKSCGDGWWYTSKKQSTK